MALNEPTGPARVTDDRSPEPPAARRLPVYWKPTRWARDELSDTCPDEPEENEVLTGLLSVRRLGIGGGPALVKLSDKRLCLLVVYFFRKNQAFEFPRGCLQSIQPIRIMPTIKFWRLTYVASDGVAAIEIGESTSRSLATARMGASIRLPHLLDELRSAWGAEAPLFIS